MIAGKEALGCFSLVIASISYIHYFNSIFKRRTKPHAFSWMIWGFLISIAFYAQYSNGAGPGAWATGLVACSCITVAVIALFIGEKDIRKSDWVTFVCALAVIPVWWLTHDPLLAVIMVIFIDMFGYYPTFRKSYYKPYEETTVAYTLGVLQVIISLLAMENYHLVNIVYPIFIMFANSAFVTMVLYRRRVLSKSV